MTWLVGLEESSIVLWLESVWWRNYGIMIIYDWIRLCHLPKVYKMVWITFPYAK